MALAGRSARRSGAGARWLAAGVVVTLLVLLIDASLHSTSPSRGQELAAGTWIDRVLPIVATSTEEGQQVSGIWTNGLTMTAPAISSELAQVATGAAHEYSAVLKLHPPALLAGSAGLLEAALLVRSQAAAALHTAFDQTLGASLASTPTATSTPPTTTATAAAASTPTTSASTPTTSAPAPPAAPPIPLQSIQTAGTDLRVGDQAYDLFVHSIPSKLGVTMPESAWLTDPSPYDPQTAQVFLTSLQNTVSATPVHQVKIYSITTTPAAVSTQGGAEVLPDASAITVTIVVADVGNQPEKNLTVTAAISPAAKGSSSVRDFVDLQPGQAHTIVGLGPLNPPQGVPVNLVVTAAPPAGSTTPIVTQTVVFSMPAPPPPSTTTTSVPASTSTTKH